MRNSYRHANEAPPCYARRAWAKQEATSSHRVTAPNASGEPTGYKKWLVIFGCGLLALIIGLSFGHVFIMQLDQYVIHH